jgi:precorrin-4/cobalt-precorrin-4 C11-methyltransferase
MLVVQKASWPDAERIVRGRLDEIDRLCHESGIDSQAMIVASPALGARGWADLSPSKLYDPAFGHRFRAASTPENPHE